MTHHHPDDQQETQIGEIANESARDPYSRTWPGVPSPRSTTAVDLAPKIRADAAQVATPGESARLLEVEAHVRATFDSRPVNAFDGFLAQIISVAPVTTVCAVLTDAPSPVTYDYGARMPGYTGTETNQALSCAAISQQITVDTDTANAGAQMNTNTVSMALVNIYLWIDGVLVDSATNVPANTASASTGAALTPGTIVTGAITAADSSDAPTIDINLSINAV